MAKTIQNRKDLKEWMARDMARNGFGSYAQWRVKLFFGNERACVVDYLRTLRRFEYWTNRKGGFMGKFCRAYYHFLYSRKGLKYGLRIGCNTVGPGLSIPHIVGGVIINCVSMGCDCGCNAGVIIGNKDNVDAKPVIGDRVSFLAGSKAFGAIKIGDNCRIAPGAVVTKDVESGTIVGGIPAKVIKANK